MNAIDFLTNEHNKVRTLFKELNATNDSEAKKELFLTIRKELIRHEQMEQQIWYKQLKLNKQWNEEIKHLMSEEHSAMKFMDRLKDNKDSGDWTNWENELKLLQEEVEAHASEEEAKLFPQVMKIMSVSDLERMGIEMKNFKENN